MPPLPRAPDPRLDLLVVQKSSDGVVEGFEIDDAGLDELRSLEPDLAELLATADVEQLGAAMEPGASPAWWCGQTSGLYPYHPLHDEPAVS